MAINRGKKFEGVLKEQFLKVPQVSIDRLHDQTTGFKGSQNICDFIIYQYPYEFYFECKSIHGASLPLTNITDTQWKGLLEKSKIKGVFAGVICWWVDKDITAFIPIKELQAYKEAGKKSIRFDAGLYSGIEFYIIAGKKKRVFFEYDLELFLREVAYNGNSI